MPTKRLTSLYYLTCVSWFTLAATTCRPSTTTSTTAFVIVRQKSFVVPPTPTITASRHYLRSTPQPSTLTSASALSSSAATTASITRDNVDNNSDNNSDNNNIISNSENQNTTTTIKIANQTFREPTSDHLQTIQKRQVFHTLQSNQVFCTSSNLCRHGHPQAFGFHPTNGPKLVSGLFRLSCPLLCEAIDEYEGEGGVRQLSDWVRTSKDRNVPGSDNTGTRNNNNKEENKPGWKQEGYQTANAIQSQLRYELTTEEDRQSKLVSRLGEYNAAAFLGSGVAGIPPGQTYNVKCVHAHVADHLCRCPSSAGADDDTTTSSNDSNDTTNNSSNGSEENGNVIGKHALQILQKRGVPIHGNDVCWQQCNVHHERGPGDWGYLAKKNRMGLRRRGENARTRRFRLEEDDDGNGGGDNGGDNGDGGGSIEN